MSCSTILIIILVLLFLWAVLTPYEDDCAVDYFNDMVDEEELLEDLPFDGNDDFLDEPYLDGASEFDDEDDGL